MKRATDKTPDDKKEFTKHWANGIANANWIDLPLDIWNYVYGRNIMGEQTLHIFRFTCKQFHKNACSIALRYNTLFTTSIFCCSMRMDKAIFAWAVRVFDLFCGPELSLRAVESERLDLLELHLSLAKNKNRYWHPHVWKLAIELRSITVLDWLQSHVSHQFGPPPCHDWNDVWHYAKFSFPLTTKDLMLKTWMIQHVLKPVY